MELKTKKTVMEGKLESSYEKFRSNPTIEKKKKKKSLMKAIRKILEKDK